MSRRGDILSLYVSVCVFLQYDAEDTSCVAVLHRLIVCACGCARIFVFVA